MKNRRLRNRLLLVFLLVLIAFGALLSRQFFVSRPSPIPIADMPAEPMIPREVVLYFGAPEGTHLVPEAREIEDCQVEQDCIRGTVQSLIDGPAGELVPILPPQAVLLNVTEEEGTVVLDFSRELITGHPGGSISELMTVYGLADTLAVNFPHIRQVRILVEGEAVETLKGHLGLQEPVPADFGYTRPPETIRTATEEKPAAPRGTAEKRGDL